MSLYVVTLVVTCLLVLSGKLASTEQDGYCFRYIRPLPMTGRGRCFQKIQEAPVASPADCCRMGGLGWAMKPSGNRCIDACQDGLDANSTAAPAREETVHDSTIEEIRANRIVEGTWGSWTAWQQCTVSCNGGFTERQRACHSSSDWASVVNFQCTGAAVQRAKCNTKIGCPVDGGWKEWSAWSPCSPACGRRGQKKRYRSCTEPAPRWGGADCIGDSIETQNCRPAGQCKVDGGWSNWGSWTCAASCANGGQGIAVRFRQCNKPKPRLGGRACPGLLAQTINCSETQCPVDGGWSVWSSWSECSSTCGESSFKHRNRLCSNPAPQHGGLECANAEAEAVQRESCNKDPCPVIYGPSSDVILSSAPCDDEDFGDGGSGCQPGSGQGSASEPENSVDIVHSSPEYY